MLNNVYSKCPYSLLNNYLRSVKKARQSGPCSVAYKLICGRIERVGAPVVWALEAGMASALVDEARLVLRGVLETANRHLHDRYPAHALDVVGDVAWLAI